MMIRTALCFSLMLALLFTCTFTMSQNTVKPDTVDLSQIKLFKKIKTAVYCSITKRNAVSLEKITALTFDTIPDEFVKQVESKQVEKDIYLKFIVKNNYDTATNIYFFPGFYYDEIRLFNVDSTTGKLIEINNASLDKYEGFKPIRFQQNETKELYGKLRFVKLPGNNLDPQLVTESFMPYMISRFKSSGKDINTFTYIFSGILLMMIFYSIAVYLITGNLEFLYYSGYAFCLGIMFYLKAYLYKTPNSFNYLFESYLDFAIHSLGTYIYIGFLRKFILAKKSFPLLNRVFTIAQYIIVISMILFTYFNFFRDDFLLQNYLEIFNKIIWMVLAIFFIVFTLHVRSRLLYYLAIGHSFLVIGGLISLYLMMIPVRFSPGVPLIFRNSIFYFELGLAIELMFFLVALAFKNRKDLVERTKESERLKLMSERQQLEKQMAVLSAKQEERNRISADMHDELGSGVTAIRLMSEIVKTKMKQQTLPEIDRISSSANDLINKMNTIIWTMKSENDSIESLITYIRTYAIEFLENTNIDCSVIMPERIPNIVLTGEKRRNIFLCVKESLNNVLKHSKANKVVISFHISDTITIIIADDGMGIDKLKLRQFGNGLNNMKKRMEGIEGQFLIENNNGTKSILVAPI